MDSMLDLFLGDPVYDENGRVVRRNFGLKNAVAICLTFYALYYFLQKTTILSGMSPKGSKKKGSKGKGSKGKIQKGGGGPWTFFVGVAGIVLTAICFWVSSSPGDIGGCMLLALVAIAVTTMFYLVEGDTKHLEAKTVQASISDTGGSG